MRKSDGSNGEKMAQQLRSVEYWLVLEDARAAAAPAPGLHASGSGGSSAGSEAGGGSEAAVQRTREAVAAALAAPDFVVVRSSSGRKKGRGRGKKPSAADLRPALLELEATTPAAAAAAGVPEEVLPAVAGAGGRVVVRVRTACANGNPVLTPAHVAEMLNRQMADTAAADGSNSGAVADEAASSSSSEAEADGAAGEEEAGDGGGGGGCSGPYRLAHIHRSEIELRPMSVPQPDYLKLRSLCRCCLLPPGLMVAGWLSRGEGCSGLAGGCGVRGAGPPSPAWCSTHSAMLALTALTHAASSPSARRMEGHLGAAQQQGTGPWSNGLENRPHLE